MKAKLLTKSKGNIAVDFYKKEKKNGYANLDRKCITDNKLF